MNTKMHIPEPRFGSKLTKLVVELDRLRHIQLGGTTPASMFFQLKEVFHLLESIGSARIEGNRTTIAEYIESKMDHTHLWVLESSPENYAYFCSKRL